MGKKANRDLIAGTAALLTVALLFCAISFKRDIGRRSTASYTLSARFNHTDGLNTGAPVRLAGIEVGKITGLTLDEDYGVTVRFSLPESVQLPDDSGVSVQSQSLLGNKYLELTPGGSEDMLSDGDFMDFTEDSPDLVKLLDKVISAAKANRKNNTCAKGK
ncbi:MAG TPA: outer membrane lipid asymmetry maintenance protein MlaD [Alphaproteobacteria bacterium]|nr:outer membrane lipid asymmetry maintenance protein MlaD [Alphaproteobacteria bacterium]